MSTNSAGSPHSPAPLAADDVEAWSTAAHAQAVDARIGGAEVTPFVLAEMARLSGGRTVEANRALVLANARLAARLAAHLPPVLEGVGPASYS